MHNYRIYVSEAFRSFTRRWKLMKGPERYGDSNSTDIDICRNIIEKCYDPKNKYFRTSLGNYPEFYSRDFGWCVESLIFLGYEEKVLDTLKYALQCYKKHGCITIVINPKGIPFNFPDTYIPDGVTFLFRSLRIAKAKDLIVEYKDFLDKEILKFEDLVIDKELCVIKNECFSGMRDYELVRSACYDMIMACALSDEIEKINKLCKKKVFDNPLKKYDLKKNLIKFYWREGYFKNGLSENYVAGHCNVYPYWLEVISDKKMLAASIKSMEDAGLDKPMPLKYGYSDRTQFLWYEFFVKDWEKDTVWAMLGMAYIQILIKADKKKAKHHLEKYGEMINKYKAFIEVYGKDAKPYKSAFFHADTSMLWASMYIHSKMILEKNEKKDKEDKKKR